MIKKLLYLVLALLLNNVITYSQIISTVAGGGIGDNMTSLSASLFSPVEITIDKDGNIYVADQEHHRIRMINVESGIISTVAGSGLNGRVGDGGLATSTKLFFPDGVAIDSIGNLYISEGHKIRKVDSATNIISTFAGDGNFGFSGDNGPAISARLGNPGNIVFDKFGNLYIADTENHRIRKIDSATGNITTIAGVGSASFSGDGGQAINAGLNNPAQIALGIDGNLYIADTRNHRIRLIVLETGIISTVAGNGSNSFSGDGGQATSAGLSFPMGLCIDSLGNLYIGDTFNHRVRKVDPNTNVINSVAGNGSAGFSGDDGSAVSASLFHPSGLFSVNSNNLYIVDNGNHRIRNLNISSSTISTVIGGSVLDSLPPTSASLMYPTSITFDSEGNLLLTDDGNNRLRKIDASQNIVTTITGSDNADFSGDDDNAIFGTLNTPRGVAIDTSNNIYIADAGNSRIRMINSSTGIISTVSGNGTFSFSGDGGLANEASLNSPQDIVFDKNNNLFIADLLNNRIRKIDAATGIISTVAGNGIKGFAGDGELAVLANLNGPQHIALDKFNNLYITDLFNQRIRMVDAATGIISTVAGNGNSGYSGDGGLAISASLNTPRGIALDSLGNLYIADFGNKRVRLVNSSTGVISTIAGNGSGNYSGDGSVATASSINPIDIALSKYGNIFIADFNNQRIRVSNWIPVIDSWNGLSSIQEDSTFEISLVDLSVTDQDNKFPDEFSLIILEGNNYSIINNTITPLLNFDGSLDLALKVNDGINDSDLFSFPIDILPVNDPPIINGLADSLVVLEEDTLEIKLLNLNVSDPDNLFPEDFSLTVLAGDNYLSNNNEVVPNIDYNGNLTVTMNVNDGLLDSEIFEANIFVIAVNDVPVIDSLRNKLFVAEEEDIEITINDLVITDPDNVYPTDFTLEVQENINYTLVGNTVTPVIDFTGSLNVSLKVKDEIDTSEIFIGVVEVTPINDSPVVANPIPDQNVIINFEYTFPSNTFSDVDDVELTYSATQSNDIQLPEWLNFDPMTRTFSGSPSDINDNITIKVSAADSGGLTVSDEFDLNILITDVENIVENQIIIYPNPSENNLELKLSNSYSGEILIDVFDKNGRVVRSFTTYKVLNNSIFSISLSGLVSDMYYIRVNSGGNYHLRSIYKQ